MAGSSSTSVLSLGQRMPDDGRQAGTSAKYNHSQAADVEFQRLFRNRLYFPIRDTVILSGQNILNQIFDFLPATSGSPGICVTLPIQEVTYLMPRNLDCRIAIFSSNDGSGPS